MANMIPGGGNSYARMASLKMKKKTEKKKNAKKNKR